MTLVACPGCGGLFPTADGPVHAYMLASPGCWDRYNDLLAREYQDPALFAVAHRFSVDAYALQHPGDPDDHRAVRSVWLHFAALDAIFARGMDHDAARRWLVRLALLDWPARPSAPTAWAVTLADLDIAGYQPGDAEHWARKTYGGWAPLLRDVLNRQATRSR